jgi:Zn ribbon nucleic-acid-binding protein
MPFRCPQCKTSDSLEIGASLEIPPDRQSCEISLQVVACSACGFRGLAVYREGRASVPESESWQHIGYWVSPDAVESVLRAIQDCPEPHNPKCQCFSHTSLGQKDIRRVWKGLLELERGHTFLMRLAREVHE